MNLKVRLTRKRKKDLNRLIDAIGFLGHIFTGDLVSPCTTTSADLSEFTPSAFSPVAVGIPEIFEDFGIHPDVPKGFFPDISAVQFQITAGLDLADMRNEAERSPS